MKSILSLIITALLAATPLVAQTTDKQPSSQATVSAEALPIFDLDFPGGTPGDLVAAIEKASSHPLNAVIPDIFATSRIPPLQMRHVTVQSLFEAMRMVAVAPQAAFYSGNPKATPDTVWSFGSPGYGTEQAICQFYLLTPYLDRGLSVDDITTAIQTGWKMSGHENAAKMSYHKETNLLIAVGAPSILQTINQALTVLAPPQPKDKKE